MCMITHIPAGIDIPFEGLSNGAIVNDDGHGWAVASRDGLEVGKSMDFMEAYKGLVEARDRHGKSSLAIFHSRFATHGIKDEFNIHPFWADHDTVVAHNGVLPAAWHPGKKDPRSDTRILVDRTIPRYLAETGIPSRRRGRELGKLIGSYNKLAILTARNGVPKVRIINAHMGQHFEGCWYSNDGFLPYYPKYYGTGYSGGVTFGSGEWGGWDWDEQFSKVETVSTKDQLLALPAGEWTPEKEIDELADAYMTKKCEVCASVGTIDFGTGICDICDTCESCWNDYKSCRCPWNQRPIGTGGDNVITFPTVIG